MEGLKGVGGGGGGGVVEMPQLKRHSWQCNMVTPILNLEHKICIQNVPNG